MAITKSYRRNRIKLRIRKIVSGTPEAPRMSVFRSNAHMYVQLIDDTTSRTLIAASTKDKDFPAAKQTKIEQSAALGKIVAEKASKAGITKVAFDRNGYLYHGRVKSLAEAAREGGLIF
jgi:large subunit ribosomal protein L18